MHGIRDVALQIAHTNPELQPLSHDKWLKGASHANVNLADQQDVTFTLTISLRGSTSLSATLPAARSLLAMTSSWPHPSFRGRFLPDTLQTSPEGFAAAWANHELSGGFPNTWPVESTQAVLSNKAVVVDLYEPVSAYRSVERRKIRRVVSRNDLPDIIVLRTRRRIRCGNSNDGVTNRLVR